MRAWTALFGIVAGIALGAAAPSRASGTSGTDTVSTPLKVVVLPARAQVRQINLTGVEEAPEWGAVVRANVDTALAQQLRQSSAFEIIEMPAIASVLEQQAIDEFVAVGTLAATSYAPGWFTPVDIQNSAAPRQLGPSLAFLHERTGADYVLATYAFQYEQSHRRATVESVLNLTLLAGLPSFYMLTMSPIYVTVFIADLRTGEMLWRNVESGTEVSGYNFTDLRKPESVQKVVAKLLADYSTMSGKVFDQDSKPIKPSKPIRPTNGGFAVQPPEGWTADIGAAEIRVSRGSSVLNNMTFQLEGHREVFADIGRQSRPESSPSQLMAGYLELLQRTQARELQILEQVTDAVLAGQPAFRLRYSYRLDAFAGGARMESEVLGTALRDGVLLATVSAPHLEYFARVLPEFESATRTIVRKPIRHMH